METGNTLLLALAYLNMLIALLSFAMFGVGLKALVRVLMKESENPKYDLNTVIINWGLLVFAVLTSVVFLRF
ncbi:MAG: hypothetical protein Q8P31_05875 [Bacillota bacterium]|nr:hypothetical protein [Bacillota bacterium]